MQCPPSCVCMQGHKISSGRLCVGFVQLIVRCQGKTPSITSTVHNRSHCNLYDHMHTSRCMPMYGAMAYDRVFSRADRIHSAVITPFSAASTVPIETFSSAPISLAFNILFRAALSFFTHSSLYLLSCSRSKLQLPSRISAAFSAYEMNGPFSPKASAAICSFHSFLKAVTLMEVFCNYLAVLVLCCCFVTNGRVL